MKWVRKETGVLFFFETGAYIAVIWDLIGTFYGLISVFIPIKTVDYFFVLMSGLLIFGFRLGGFFFKVNPPILLQILGIICSVVSTILLLWANIVFLNPSLEPMTLRLMFEMNGFEEIYKTGRNLVFDLGYNQIFVFLCFNILKGGCFSYWSYVYKSKK